MATLHCIGEVKNSEPAATGSDLVTQFDGVGVEAGDVFFKTQAQEQDDEDHEMQHFGGESERDHEHTDVKQPGIKREHMDAHQMLDANHQLNFEDEVGEVAHLNPNQYHNQGVEESQHVDAKMEFVNLNQTFNSTIHFKNEAGPDNSTSMDLDYHDDSEDREDEGIGSQILGPANEFTNEAARREAAALGQDYVNQRMQPFVSGIGSQPFDFRNVYQMNEPRQRLKGMEKGPQNTGVGNGRAHPAAMYAQHTVNIDKPQLYQRESGSRYGSPAQRPMHTVDQTSFGPASTAPLHSANTPIERPMFPKTNNGSQVINLCDDSSSHDSSSHDSSDDEPLRTRMLRYTVSGSSVSRRPSPTFASRTGAQDVKHEALESDVEIEGAKFDFKLPSHEVIYEESPDGFHFAKVSLPGLVREAIMLSPDHSEEEYYLFLNVFLPSHLSLSTPDHEPAIGVLNFHTVAGLVIETYHLIHDEEFKEMTDIDPDDVFFQVMDKWRVGMMSGKEGYKVVRGVQEFCDIALDLIFWIKEHGFGDFNSEPAKTRKERSDKGIKRGPKTGVTNTIGQDLDTETIAQPSAKVNTLQARNKAGVKAKVEPKKKLGRPAGRVEKEKKKKTPGKVMVIKSQAGQKK